ncbi:Myelin-associated neurite-outgrowth inhibitor [Lemmus lemmus]
MAQVPTEQYPPPAEPSRPAKYIVYPIAVRSTPNATSHTMVGQPNGTPAAFYPAPIPHPKPNRATMGMAAVATVALPAPWSLYNSYCPSPITAPTFQAPTGAAGLVPPARTFCSVLGSKPNCVPAQQVLQPNSLHLMPWVGLKANSVLWNCLTIFLANCND